WTGVQHSRAGQHDQLVVGSRNPWVRESIPLAAVIVYAVAPVAAAVFATSIINLSWGRAGAVWPSYIWLTLTTVILAVSTGYLLGRLLPSPFTGIPPRKGTRLHVRWDCIQLSFEVDRGAVPK